MSLRMVWTGCFASCGPLIGETVRRRLLADGRSELSGASQCLIVVRGRHYETFPTGRLRYRRACRDHAHTQSNIERGV